MVLEAVGAGTQEGTLVSINKPAGTAGQKWLITPAADGFHTLRPSYSSTLVLAVEKGETKNGSRIVLETGSGKPSQQWRLKKDEASGAYSLEPRHAPGQGLDDFAGAKEPGSKIDLWVNTGKDQHLQWQIRPLAGSGAVEPQAEAATYVAPEIKPEDILPGEIKTFQFTTSQVFPGTVRDVTVFIPKQYDAAKPACVYVKTDGYNPREKVMMETMIATKEMPVTVGVFVRPGDLPAPVKGAMGRRNRCFEYDGVGDNTVRFLVDELLPFVAKECNLNLSKSGNDRCMSGGSSGGISAFNTAWERPEEFSRVYAASGSFVAFRGGHEFPTLVRKFEAKPIRAFLTTGTHDMENCAGDWFLIDQEMDKALKFAGYDYIFRIINGGHVAGYMENYREAMAYLWKGWPEAVKAGPSAPRARDILIPEESWQVAADHHQNVCGAASNAAGEVFFIDPAEDKICRLGLDGKVSDFVAHAGRASGLTVGADGTVYAISEELGKLVSYDDKGKATLAAHDLHGRYVLALPNGGLYVTANKPGRDGSGEVWHVKDGKKTRVDSGLKGATGLALRPDQWLLAVAEGNSKWARSYQVTVDGKLENKERFFWLHVADWDDDAGAEAACYAKEGQLFIATRSGIEVCADDGPTQVILPLPGRSRPVSVCLGGKDGDTLFAFAGNKIWKRKVQVHACGAFTPFTAVKPTHL